MASRRRRRDDDDDVDRPTSRRRISTNIPNLPSLNELTEHLQDARNRDATLEIHSIKRAGDILGVLIKQILPNGDQYVYNFGQPFVPDTENKLVEATIFRDDGRHMCHFTSSHNVTRVGQPLNILSGKLVFPLDIQRAVGNVLTVTWLHRMLYHTDLGQAPNVFFTDLRNFIM